MTILKNPEIVALEIAEGSMVLTFKNLMDSSSDILRQLFQKLIITQNNIRWEDSAYNGRDATEETEMKLLRIDCALSVLNDYCKEYFIQI